MRRIDDYIRAGADPKMREEFMSGIETPLIGGSTGRTTASLEADKRRREREMGQFLALKAATSGA